MNDNKYKILFYLSLVCNLVLIVLLYKPLPKEEQEMLDFMRTVNENSSSVLPEAKSDEIKHVSNQVIRTFAEAWSVEAVKPLFNPKVLEQIGEGKLADILELYSKLGRYQKQLLPESVETVPGKENMMLYGTNVKYEAGEAYVSLVLEKLEDDWYINNININSEVFLKQLK